MNRTNFQDVGDFMEKFGLPFVDEDDLSVEETIPGPRDVSPEVLAFRREFLEEELQEFREGLDNHDHAQMADALVDLVYIAMGTAHIMGYPWQQIWEEVQNSNMMKARAQADGSDSKRHSGWDVVKPDGWPPPDVAGILMEWGFLAPGKAFGQET